MGGGTAYGNRQRWPRRFRQSKERGASLMERIYGKKPRSSTRTSIRTNWPQTSRDYGSSCIDLGEKTNQGQVVFEFEGNFWPIDKYDPPAGQ